MRTMIIYEAEEKDGLVQQIEASSSIAYVCKVEPCDIEAEKKVLLSYASEDDDSILYPTKSVLVTTNWNKNDDIFLREPTWAARHTPRHKPTNIEHNKKEIVGHVTDTWVMDFGGEIVAEDTQVEDLPYFHLCNGAVIYKFYPKEPDLEARANKLIEEIKAGTKYVSMECRFSSFDYGLSYDKSDIKIVKRNSESAYLTKHLRTYGGTGEYNGYKIGRVLRNIEFSGKGYVDVPANPDSIIFTSDDKIMKNVVNASLADIKAVASEVNNVEHPIKETIMEFTQKDFDKAEKVIAELTQSNKDLEAKMAAIHAEKFETQIAELKIQLEEANSEKGGLSTKVEELKSEVAKSTESVAAVTKAKEEAEAKFAAAELVALKTNRVSALVDGGIEKANAETSVDKFMSLNDEQFAEVAKALLATVKASTEETKPVASLTTADEITKVEKEITKANVEEEISIPTEDANENHKKLITSLSTIFATQMGLVDEKKSQE